MKNEEKYEINLSEIYVNVISSRDSIALLLKKYYAASDVEIVLNFDRILFISRSAAQQLILERKILEQNRIRLRLENLSPFVNQMIQLADAKRKKNPPVITSREFDSPLELQEFLTSF